MLIRSEKITKLNFKIFLIIIPKKMVNIYDRKKHHLHIVFIL